MSSDPLSDAKLTVRDLLFGKAKLVEIRAAAV